jgi:virginiamycin B lyase
MAAATVATSGRKSLVRAVLVAAALVAGITPGVVSAPAASAGGQAGVFTNYRGTGIVGPCCITTGPDGALWFTNEANLSIGRISTAGDVTNVPANAAGPIVAGPDGEIWFLSGPHAIGRMTTAGEVTTFTDPSITGFGDIVVGSDGAFVVPQLRDCLARPDHHVGSGQ